ncbi:MAG TPA: MBL fold metallo-hydrolase [Prolixibacteraceae bacterium]|jgi:glyoxylase-like metal-dependent hydrolase (beta-lactamase superfamily II)
MRKWKTKNGCEIFQVLNRRSNSYLICTENGNILVDTGRESAYIQLQKNMDSINFNQENINLLILTHTHYDHCQNAAVIKEKANCKILMSEYEACYPKFGYTPLPGGTFAITRFISNLGNRIGQRRFGYNPFIPEMLVTDKLDLVTCKISIISTNGHSSGSISVIIDNEIAVVGDAMIGVFSKSIFPPFADDINKMIISWGKLLETTCQVFLPGHGKEIKRELLQSEFDKYVQKYNIRKK